MSIVILLEICLLSGCDYFFSNSTDSSSIESSSNTSTLKNYVIESLEEKYGMEFEIVKGSAPLLTTAVDFDVKCVDDGVLFGATVQIKDTREMISENYLCYKYKDDFIGEFDDYASQFFDEYKLGNSGVLTFGELPFDTPSDLLYSEVKERMVEKPISYNIEIYIPDTSELTQEDIDMLSNKFSNEGGWYKSDLGMNVDVMIFTFLREDYDALDSYTENMSSTVCRKRTRII